MEPANDKEIETQEIKGELKKEESFMDCVLAMMRSSIISLYKKSDDKQGMTGEKSNIDLLKGRCLFTKDFFGPKWETFGPQAERVNIQLMETQLTFRDLKHQDFMVNQKKIQYIYCSDCSFRTKYESNLVRHRAVSHTRERKGYMRYEKCTQCNFKTRYSSHLTRHQVDCHNQTWDHWKVRRYNQSNFTSEPKTDLSSRNVIPPVNAEDFRCKRCPFVTKQKSSFVSHLFSHVMA